MKTQIVLICLLVALASAKWMKNSNFLSNSNKHLQDGWPSPGCFSQLDDITSLKFKLQQRKHATAGFSQLVFELYWSNGIAKCIDEDAAHMKFYLTSITDGTEKNCEYLNEPVEDGPNAAKYIALPNECEFSEEASATELCGDPKYGNWNSQDTNFKEGVLATHVTVMYFKYDDIIALTDAGFLEIKHVMHSKDGGVTPNYDETTVMAQMQLWFNEGGVHKWMNFDFGIRKYLDGRTGDPFDFSATEMKKAQCENNDCYVDKHFQICSTYVESKSNWAVEKQTPFVFNKRNPIFIKFNMCGDSADDYKDYKLKMTKYSVQLKAGGSQQTIWTQEEPKNKLTFPDGQQWDAESREIRVQLVKISLKNGKGNFYGDFRAVHTGTGLPVTKSETKAAAYESFQSRKLEVDPPIATTSASETMSQCDDEIDEACNALAPGGPDDDNSPEAERKKESRTVLYLAIGAFVLGVVAVVIGVASKKFDEDNTYLKEDYNEIE